MIASPRIRRFRLTEVVVPARPNAVNHADLVRPLHKLPVAGKDGWSVQFDELPKLILEMELSNGLIALSEFYRGHSWATVEAVARRFLGMQLSDIPLQAVPVARCREHDGFELAIWDAFAKSHEMRLCELLGGAVREAIKVGAWTGHRKVEEIGPMAADFARRGYDCWKFKCDLEDDVLAWCEAVAAAAPDMSVILDPNERWEQSHEAARRLRALSEVGNLLCLEDPLPRWMLVEYGNLRRLGLGAIALPIGLGGDALASETAGPSANEEAWQFHVIPDGESGGLETFLESGIESFSLGVVFKPKEASVPEHVQYLAGISDRAFLRITEANMLEAGLRGTDDVWVQVRFPLYKIRPLNQWIQVEVRYESQELSLSVNGQVEDSLTLKHYRIFSGARFVVATCPWDSSTGHFVGSIASLKLAMIDESSESSR